MQSTINQNEQKMQTTMLLEELYKNAKMGAEALLSLLPKVADSNMRRDLTAQLDGYEGYAKQAEQYLCEQGKEAKDAGV